MAVLPRIVALIPVEHGSVTRTKLFQPDYTYTNQFLDFQDFDEVVFLDVSRNSTFDLEGHFSTFVQGIYPRCFLPTVLGGGVRSEEEAARLFDLGADRVIVGSAAINDVALISQLAQRWGSQAVVVGVSYIDDGDCGLSVVTSSHPLRPARPAIPFIREVQDNGAGELVFNSVMKDGSLSGFDLRGVQRLARETHLPYLVAGGAGNWHHFREAFVSAGASGVITSNIYHLTSDSIVAAKKYLDESGIPVRQPRRQ